MTEDYKLRSFENCLRRDCSAEPTDKVVFEYKYAKKYKDINGVIKRNEGLSEYIIVHVTVTDSKGIEIRNQTYEFCDDVPSIVDPSVLKHVCIPDLVRAYNIAKPEIYKRIKEQANDIVRGRMSELIESLENGKQRKVESYDKHNIVNKLRREVNMQIYKNQNKIKYITYLIESINEGIDKTRLVEELTKLIDSIQKSIDKLDAIELQLKRIENYNVEI